MRAYANPAYIAYLVLAFFGEFFFLDHSFISFFFTFFGGGGKKRSFLILIIII